MRKEAGFENRDRFVELGLMISALRKAKGYTQYELAEKAHISRSHLSSIEAPNITASFSLEVFFNIADILGVKPGDLLNLNLPSSYFNKDEKDKNSKDKQSNSKLLKIQYYINLNGLAELSHFL